MVGIEVIKSGMHRRSKWSGGTSTELYIYPPEADYTLRNFKFRLSTATIEAERSEFTILPGVSRQLMILAGCVTVSHEGRYSKAMKKFDTDLFEGDWKTSSEGQCVDFNLMTTGKTRGVLKAKQIQEEQLEQYTVGNRVDLAFIYLFSGNLQIRIDLHTIYVQPGDLVLLNKPFGTEMPIQAIETSELVIAEIIL